MNTIFKYNSHGKYKPELNEYFHMYQCQLNFALFCVTSVLGISWQHLNHPNLLVRTVCRLHVYFHVPLILHELGIFYHMKMVSARLKMLTLRVHIAVSVMIVALMQMKHGCMETGFIWQILLSLDIILRLQKDLHKTILHDGSLHSLKVLQERALNK